VTAEVTYVLIALAAIEFVVHANAILRNRSRESPGGAPSGTEVRYIVGDKPLGAVTDASKAYFDEAQVGLAPERETGSTASVALAGVGTVEEQPLFFECGRPSGLLDAVELTDVDLFAVKVGALRRAGQ
jgi:hypothetical protein